MKLFADCADIAVMHRLQDQVEGFTTNPTLMRGKVRDYERFGRECLFMFPDHSISFEVLADDLDSVSEQARKIAAWGDNVYAKVPISLTDGTSTVDLIRELAADGVRINVTAVFTRAQAARALGALEGAQGAYLSVFAGRIADAGVDPTVIVRDAVRFAPRNVEVIWASTREVFNIVQAERAGAHIITVTPELLAKSRSLGKDLEQFSLETVQMFRNDAVASGLAL